MQVTARVISNVEIAPSVFRMSLDAAGIARSALPGQFVHVACHGPLSLDPLLRRPFSICGVDRQGGAIDIIYQVVGRGTELLSRIAVGVGGSGRQAAVDILGPLGRGFGIPRDALPANLPGRPDTSEARYGPGAPGAPCACAVSPVLLVGGGLGVAPLIFLAQALAGQGIQADVIVGARSRDLILGVEEFAQLGCDVELATEDGSAGARGLVTELVERRLGLGALADGRAGAHTDGRVDGGHVDGRGAPAVRYAAVFACGPAAMLEAVARLAMERGVPCQVSLEERMACGVGACLGCVVKTRAGYRRVCADGPVFDAVDVFFLSASPAG
ncbi:MAG: dihydroorotate dehydrogenase electron transfer subunit [Firmicutes bacterium]|nr:dihydroorotate dehydrogenase electron transfer subunit [Bacillota bacterium]